jgi:hypothetical protein
VPRAARQRRRARALRLLTALRAAVGRHRIAIVVTVLVLVGAYLIVLGVLAA